MYYLNITLDGFILAAIATIAYYGNHYIKKKFEALAEKSEIVEINSKLEELKLINAVKSQRQIEYYKVGETHVFELIELAHTIALKVSDFDYSNMLQENRTAMVADIKKLNSELNIAVNQYSLKLSIIKGIYSEDHELIIELEKLSEFTLKSFKMFNEVYNLIVFNKEVEFESIDNETIRSYFDEFSKGNYDYEIPEIVRYANQSMHLINSTTEFYIYINAHISKITQLLKNCIR